MAKARIVDGEIVPLTEDDRRELDRMFPDGNIVLTSDNCPELAAAIEMYSDMLLEQNKDAYEALARYD